MLAVPLIAGDRVLGAVLTVRDTLGPFAAEQVALAESIATHAALALENAHLFSLEASRRTQIEALTEVSRELVGELSLERLLELVAVQAGRLFEARATIFVLQGDLLVPEASTEPRGATLPIRVGEGITGLCAARRQGLLVNDYPSRPEALERWLALDLRRLMVQPLIVRDQILGVIGLSRRGDQPRGRA